MSRLDLDIRVPGIAALMREDQPDSPEARLWADGECFFCLGMGRRVRYVGHYRIPGFSAPMCVCGPCLSDRADMALAYSQSGGRVLLNYPEWHDRISVHHDL